MVLETLRDRIKEGRGEGKEIKEIVEGLGLCDPPSTDIFRIGRYHPETKTVTGARYEEDGDQKDWGPVELSRILEYYDFKTFGSLSFKADEQSLKIILFVFGGDYC